MDQLQLFRYLTVDGCHLYNVRIYVLTMELCRNIEREEFDELLAKCYIFPCKLANSAIRYCNCAY